MELPLRQSESEDSITISGLTLPLDDRNCENFSPCAKPKESSETDAAPAAAHEETKNVIVSQIRVACNTALSPDDQSRQGH